jgi:hypothetical protein
MTTRIVTLKYLFVIIGILLMECTNKQTEAVGSNSIDTTKLQKLDSVPTTKKVRTALKDTVLTITADSVKALYYPNTGKVVMTLKKGDVCKITRTGRYDVVDNKGNFWIRVERMGGRGWIFGGHTSIESDLWIFSEGMTEIGHPHNTYKLNKITASQFPELFNRMKGAIKKTELTEGDEGGTRKIETKADEITVLDDDGLGTISSELFKLGPAADSVYSINYKYEVSGDVKTTFNHAFVAFWDGKAASLVSDFFGELKEIYRVGDRHIFVSDYSVASTNLGMVHLTNVTVWSARKKAVVNRQRFGHSAVENTGYPIFKKWDDGSFVANATCTFAREGDGLTMQVFETYNRLNDDDSVTEKVFFITRYFTFNPATSRFDESKQEVIYQAK